MKMIYKKILYILPLIIAIAIVVGIATGKLDKDVDKVKEYVEETNKDEGASDKENFDESSKINEQKPDKEIPAGKINLLEYFTWIDKPKVEVFDPENRILGMSSVYGMTREEEKYHIELIDKQEKYNKVNPIPDNLKGNWIHNKERLLSYGESYYIEAIKATVTYSKFEVKDGFKGLDSKYITEYDGISREEFEKKLDKDSKLSNMCYYKKYAGIKEGEKVENAEYKLVMFEINIKCDCEWVILTDIVPLIYYLEEDKTGKALVNMEPNIYGDTESIDIACFLPKYLDIVDNMPEIDEDPRFYPMRKGDDITFRVGYLVPVDYMDNAYLWFDKNGYPVSGDENRYNEQNYILMKLIQQNIVS